MKNFLARAVLALLVTSPVFAEVMLKSQPPKFGAALRAIDEAEPTSVEFVNRTGKSLQIYHVNADGRREAYRTLRAGQSLKVETYVTHPWVVTDAAGATTIGVFLPLKQPGKVLLVAK